MRALAVRIAGVQQHHKGLSDLLQFPDHPFLCFFVILPWNIRHRTVRGNDNAHSRVIGNHLLRADLCRLCHGDLVIVPGRHHHAGRQILKLPHSAGHHISHTVNKPNGEADAFLQLYLHSFLRYKLRFGGHNGTSRTALGQFILCPVASIYVVDMGDHLRFHKTLDKGGLPCSDRSHHADIHTVLRPCRHVLIDTCGSIHSTFLRCCFYCITMWSCRSICKISVPFFRMQLNISVCFWGQTVERRRQGTARRNGAAVWKDHYVRRQRFGII